MPQAYKKATMLPRFYDRIAQSIGGMESCPRVFQFAFGHGYVDETTDPPTLESVPSDLSDIPGKFHTVELAPEDLSYSDGRLIIRCRFPAGSVAEPKKYSITGLYDALGNLLAVTQDLPDWLTPTDDHTTYIYLDFPHVGEEPPTVF